MSLPRTVAEVLGEHVTLEVEGIDRMYLNVYQPRLQTERGVAAFFRCHRGETFASSALMDPMSKAFIAAVDRFVLQEQIPLITFAKGQRKDDVAKEHHARSDGNERILFVGKAQEKTPVFRTEKRRNPDTGQTYPWIVRSTAMVNHFYFYGLDEDFGPFFLKFCTYFPYVAVHTPIDNCKTPVFQGSGNMRAAPYDIGCCVSSIIEAIPVSSDARRRHSGLFFERFRSSKDVNR